MPQQPPLSRTPKAAPALARQLNRANLLRLIRERGPISRAEVASITGLAKNSVSSIFEALHAEGLIRSDGFADASQKGGRRRELWSIDPGAGLVVGIDLERSRIEGAIMSFDGQIVAKYRSTPSGAPSKAAILRSLRTVLDRLRECERRRANRVIGVGVATFGRLDAGKAISNCYGLVPDWNDVPLRQIIQERTGWEATLETNLVACATAEKWFGAAKAAQDFAVLLFRTGVGVGLCANGSILSGSSGRAGELGHITVDEDGPACACGGRGCLEAVASRAALIARIRRAASSVPDSVLLADGNAESVTLDAVIQAANTGDQLAAGILAETAQHVGVALASLLCLTDPELIAIGPALSRAGGPVIQAIAEEVRKRIPGADERALRVEPSPLGDDLVLVGAGALVFARALDSPIIIRS